MQKIKLMFYKELIHTRYKI